VPQPKVVFWFKIYCGVLCLLYLALAAVSLLFFFMDPATLNMTPGTATLWGVLLLVMGLVLFAGCLVPLILRPRPWLWIYDTVIIALGLTSPLFLPASIPLLIFWLKPETRIYFGRT